jgi:hypothetical protein
MADDNQGSRTFLAIVLGGIVLALVIAAFFMYGHKGSREVKVQQPMSETPAPPPASEAPASEAPASEPPAIPPSEMPAPAAPSPEIPAPEMPQQPQ